MINTRICFFIQYQIFKTVSWMHHYSQDQTHWDGKNTHTHCPKVCLCSAGNCSYKIKHLCMIFMYLRIVRSGFNRKVAMATYNLKNWCRALSFTLLPGLSMFPQLLLVWMTPLNSNMACLSNRHLQVKSLKLLGNYKKQSSLSWSGDWSISWKDKHLQD